MEKECSLVANFESSQDPDSNNPTTTPSSTEVGNDHFPTLENYDPDNPDRYIGPNGRIIDLYPGELVFSEIRIKPS